MKLPLAKKEGAGFTTVWGDLADEDVLQTAIQGQDAVIHLAAIIPPLAYDDAKTA